MKTKLGTWRRFWNLNVPSRRIVIEAGLALLATWIGLRVAGYNRWKRALDRLSPRETNRGKRGDPTQLKSAQEIARLAHSAARHILLPTNCLDQSMALCWMLRRRGAPAELRFGARKQEGQFEAHAWVEVGGVVLNEAQERHKHFAAFDRSVAPLEIQTP